MNLHQFAVEITFTSRYEPNVLQIEIKLYIYLQKKNIFLQIWFLTKEFIPRR